MAGVASDDGSGLDLSYSFRPVLSWLLVKTEQTQAASGFLRRVLPGRLAKECMWPGGGEGREEGSVKGHLRCVG